MPQVDDVAVEIRLKVFNEGDPQDLTNFEVYEIDIKKPSGNEVTLKASVGGNDSNILIAKTDTNTLDESGLYEMQGYLNDLDTSAKYHTSVETFRVDENI